MNRPAQRIIIIVVALLLVVPIGAVGLSQLFGGGEGDDPEQQTATGQTEEPEDDRPTADPDELPPRPELERPEEPAAMSEQTPEGAEATLNYLLESYTYMMTSGDTSVWEESISEGCEVCMSFLGNAELLREQDGYLVDGEFTVISSSFDAAGGDEADGADGPDGADDASDASGPPSTGMVTARFEQDASQLVDDPTRVPWELEPVAGTIGAAVRWDGDSWQVEDMMLTELDGEDAPGAVPGGDAPGG